MQVGDALQGGASTIPGRLRLKVLLAILAIVVIAALVALLVRPTPLAGSGAGAGVGAGVGVTGSVPSGGKVSLGGLADCAPTTPGTIAIANAASH